MRFLFFVIFFLLTISSFASIQVRDLYEVGQGNVVMTGHSTYISNQYIYSPYGSQKNLNHPVKLNGSANNSDQALTNATRRLLNLQHNQFGYTGQFADPSTGLIMLGGFRNYAPAIGRFIQPDTYNSFSKHRVDNPSSYVNANPISLIDPSGHFAWEAFFQDAAKGLIQSFNPEDFPREIKTIANAANDYRVMVGLPEEVKASATNVFTMIVNWKDAHTDAITADDLLLALFPPRDLTEQEFSGLLQNKLDENVLLPFAGRENYQIQQGAERIITTRRPPYEIVPTQDGLKDRLEQDFAITQKRPFARIIELETQIKEVKEYAPRIHQSASGLIQEHCDRALNALRGYKANVSGVVRDKEWIPDPDKIAAARRRTEGRASLFGEEVAALLRAKKRALEPKLHAN